MDNSFLVDNTQPLMTIGALAHHAGVTADTVRYYERRGLLPRPRRTAGGHRVYGADDLARLRGLRRAQALGFSLDEAASLLALSDAPASDAAEVLRQTREKVADIDRRIDELAAMRRTLVALADACGGADTSRAECSILDALLGGSSATPP